MPVFRSDLIAENRTLRNMVRGLGSFIGDDAGGALASMGWTLKEYEDFLTKADTDTAYEAFSRYKKVKQTSTGEKRLGSEDPTSRKRPKIGNGFESGDVNFSSGLGSTTFTPYPSDPSINLFHNIRSPANYTSSYINNLTDPQGAPNTFLAGTSTPTGMGFSSSSSNGRDPFPAPYPSGPNTPSHTSAGASSLQTSFLPMGPPNASSNVQAATSSTSNSDDLSLEDSKAQEARKLVAYHLDNYRRNQAYCLPPSLRPTLVQRTVEHGESFLRLFLIMFFTLYRGYY